MSSSTHSIFVWSRVLAFLVDVNKPLMYAEGKQDIHQVDHAAVLLRSTSGSMKGFNTERLILYRALFVPLMAM